MLDVVEIHVVDRALQALILVQLSSLVGNALNLLVVECNDVGI